LFRNAAKSLVSDDEEEALEEPRPLPISKKTVVAAMAAKRRM
jgi:hypothetical protein